MEGIKSYFRKFLRFLKIERGKVVKMKFKIQNQTEESNAEIGLIESKDGTGINLFADVTENGESKRFYLLRLLHEGKVLIFKGNNAECFKTDSCGRLLVDFRECDNC